MKIVIYEKPEPLGTFLLGVVEDVPRHQFDALVPILSENGYEVTRQIDPTDAPLRIELEGKCIHTGTYPDAKTLSKILNLDPKLFKDAKTYSALNIAAKDTRISACCGVGTDVYLDPYEDDES